MRITEYNLMPQNAAKLTWVQVTQLLKRPNCISVNGQQRRLLDCWVCLVFLSFFTVVALGSSVRSLTSTSDRFKAHSLSLLVRRRRHQPSVLPACSVPERPADGDTAPHTVCGASVSPAPCTCCWLDEQPVYPPLPLLKFFVTYEA